MKRREVVRLGALASSLTLPVKWMKPIVNTIILPAHAQTSCVLHIQNELPQPGVFIHSTGEIDTSIGDVNRIIADITFHGSSIVFSLFLDSASSITLPSTTINCNGTFSPVQASNSGNVYMVSGDVARIDVTQYLVRLTLNISGVIPNSGAVDIHTFLHIVGP